MKVSPHNRQPKRTGPYSSDWLRIFQTRFFLSIFIAAFGLTEPVIRTNRQFWLAIVLYLAILLGLGLFSSNLLSLRRVKLVPALIDFAFISSLVYFPSDTDNAWFMLYVFPIISVSRYLGLEGGLWLAALASLSYFSVSLLSDPNPKASLSSLIFRCLVFFAVAAAQGSFAKARQTDQGELVAVIEEIDSALLKKVNTDEVLNLILRKALQLTNSEMGHLRLVDPYRKDMRIVAVIGHPEGPEWATQSFDETFSRMAINLKGYLIVPQITRRHLKRYFGTYFRLRRPRPKSACFVPLRSSDAAQRLIGLIAVYSKWRFHYRKIDARRLEVFTPLIEMAIKTATDQHLHLLYEIGQGLRKGFEKRQDLFKHIVNLTAVHLGSEEAALFIRDETDQTRVRKVEVGGFDGDDAATLLSLETEYAHGESLTGRVFASGRPIRLNNVSPTESGAKEYASMLPSRTINHYVGAPLIIDGKCLGVIRILNKKASNYSAADKPILSQVGFRQEDEQLLEFIASLVAPEIRDADRTTQLIEARAYYQNLIVNSPDPIIALDKTGNIVIFNRACQEIWGFSFEEVRNQPVVDYYASAETAGQIGRKLWENDYSIQNYETFIKDRHGTPIPISLSACFIFRDGQRIGSIGVFKDLREVKRLQNQVIETEKLATVGRLARTAGHEIKHNLATAVHLIRPLLRTSDQKKDPQLHRIYSTVLDVIWESVGKLQNLLTADKPQPPQKADWRLSDLLRRVEEDIGRQARDRGIKLLVAEVAQDCKTSVDIEQMDQVFGNLFTNAAHAIQVRRATEQSLKGQIEVSTEVAGNEVRIVWGDNGCGISESDLPNIFNAFFTASRSEAGTGLGLHIVRTIVRSLNGEIQAESEVGTGTRLIISLPVKPPQQD